ncbi:MAG: SDR family NAD(P)-dependent oxidoreductase [Armatimonadota bacterium]
MRAAIVTGAAHGIGRRIAMRLARDGMSVLLTDRDEAGLKDGVAEIAHEVPGATVAFVASDLVDPTAPDKLVEACRSRFGRVDHLVNNAADQTPGGIVETDLTTWNRVMAVNVTAPFLLAKAALADLAENRGAIVILGSLVGNQPIPDRTAYCTSKAAVAGLARVMAAELGAFGVRVNALAPGHIMTDGRDDWETRYTPAAKSAFPMSYPIGRVGDADEVAGVVSFLLSEDAGFITGATIPIDGGMSILCPETAVFRTAGLI